MNSTVAHASEKSTSWTTTLVAVIPFIYLGLVLIFSELPHEWMIPSWARSLGNYLLIGTIAFLPIGFCIGWIQGFPRWSYPYVGQFLLFSLYMMRQPTPGVLFGKGLLRWRAWIPLLVIAVLSLLVTRSFYSLKRFLINISADWTVLTFGMFGFMPLLIAIIYDEMDRLYSLYFMVVLTLLMVVTVIVYMQSSNHKKRVSALVVGIFLTTTIAVSGPAWFWFNQMKATFWPVVIAGIVIYLIMFSPALIGIFHKPVQTV